MGACMVLVVVAPLDVRFGWSRMPWQVSVAGDALVALSFYVFYLVSKVNTYAAANVHVEAGQRVVSSGVYALSGIRCTLARWLYLVGTPSDIG
jgi:protein-S-isoprenylcysteine O-methyltransferase Ste14